MPVSERTWTVVVERPLKPQPPHNARPYWCFSNTLIFYDRDMKEVWRQEIPEAYPVRIAMLSDATYRVERLGTYMRVRRTRRWGWLLHIEYDHELAHRAWPFDMLTTVPDKGTGFPHLKGVP